MWLQLLEEACAVCIAQLASERGATIARLGDLEDYVVLSASHKAGRAHVVGTRGGLRTVL